MSSVHQPLLVHRSHTRGQGQNCKTFQSRWLDPTERKLETKREKTEPAVITMREWLGGIDILYLGCYICQRRGSNRLHPMDASISGASGLWFLLHRTGRSEDVFVCLKSYDEGRIYQCNELLHLHEKRTTQKSIPWVIRIAGIAMI